MKTIFDYINHRSTAFTDKPLFRYLRDKKIDSRQRLQFVPWTAHFVMTFADLYHFFLTEPAPRDRYQELVNTHLSEEGSHWKWFLADLRNLDLDPTLRFTDALRVIWSDETIKTRTLAYEMCKLSAGMNSLQKLVMVLAIEATGRVALEAAVPTGCEVEATTGRRLVYFGGHRLDTEREHTVEARGVHLSLEETKLAEPIRAELRFIVDQVFDRFGDFVDEAFHLAQGNRGLAESVQTISPASGTV